MASFLEIYNEHVYDLLSKDPLKSLEVRESPADKSFYVPELTRHAVAKKQDFLKLIELAISHRRTARTKYNDESSRSHSMLTIYLEKSIPQGLKGQKLVAAKLNLVDLVGCWSGL